MVDGEVARLVELGLAHEQHGFGPVDVGVVEFYRLADPHSGRGEQSDQRLVGRGDQPLADRSPRPLHQREDLLVGVDERLSSVAPQPDQSGWRDLCPRVDPRHVAREPAGDEKAHRWNHTPCRRVRLDRPIDREIDGHAVGTDHVDVGGELA